MNKRNCTGKNRLKTQAIISFGTYAKFSEKLTFLTHWLCADQVIRNVSFSENFTYVLNKWSPISLMYLIKKVTFNPFQANAPLVYPLETLENL